jgi:hypothetical protein
MASSLSKDFPKRSLSRPRDRDLRCVVAFALDFAFLQ